MHASNMKDHLFVSVVTALKAYSDLNEIYEHRHSLEKIITSALSIYEERRFNEFANNILKQIRSILCLGNTSLEESTSGFIAMKIDDIYEIRSGYGQFVKFEKLYMEDMVDPSVMKVVKMALEQEEEVYLNEQYAKYLKDKKGQEHIIYVTSHKTISDWDKNLLGLFSMKLKNDFTDIYSEIENETKLEEVLFALGEVVEARAKVIGNHVQRVAAYSRFICDKLDFSDEDADLLSMASSIHDIGKVLIDETILNKPVKLTDEEFELVKGHPMIGHKILREIEQPIFEVASEIALTHHEKYDGSGYPSGLMGNDIPLSGRIVAFADVIDALTSDSVYKKAWPMEDVIELVKKESGKHFDPRIVNIWLEHLEAFNTLKEKLNV